MNWRGVLFLDWRYLAGNRVKTLLLVAAFTLVWLLPSGLALVVGKVEERLRSRAGETPLLLGQAGSPLELVFNGLYFTKPGIAKPLQTAAIEPSMLSPAPASVPVPLRRDDVLGQLIQSQTLQKR